MTKMQEKRVKQIKENWTQLCHGIKYAEKYEIKEWEVEELKYFVSLIIEVGLKNDEGTMAQVYCRKRCHIFIYKGGRMTYPISHKKKDGSWKFYYKELNGRVDLFKVYVDQSK